MAGSMMQNAAILWHVSLLVEPANRGLALGMVGLVRVVPIVTFSLVAGVIADARDRRRLMLFTQTGMAMSAALLSWVAFAGVKSVWPIYALAATGAAFGTFDNPARQALMPTLVPAADLPNAISLNAIMFQTAAVVGPAAGGVLIGEFGVPWAYACNAASFLFVIGAVLAMRGISGRAEGSNRGVSLAAGTRGAAIRVLDAAHSLHDVARLLRDVLRIGHGAPADLRAGHPARRCSRLWVVVICTVGRRDTRQPRDGPSGRPHRSSRPGAAVGDWRVRPCDGRVRPLSRVPAVIRLSRADRRRRYGQHGDPQSGPATDDARLPCVGE